MNQVQTVLLVAALLAMPASVGTSPAQCPRTDALLQDGQETVRVVAFGDSITGVYYHSGALRAWCDMLGIGLSRVYPQAKLEMVNAGISSQTTVHALERIQRDVLDLKPQLVVVAFGMNDIRTLTRSTPQQYHDNLAEIVSLCRGVGAEVVLCTPTSIYPGHPQWDPALLEEYSQVLRQVGAELDVAVADIYKAYQDLRARDRRAWMLLMSETIHPDMNGHKVIAEQVARVVTGQTVSLADVPPVFPNIPFTLGRLAEGQPVNVVAMEPYDSMIEQVLREISPTARVEVTPWPAERRSLPKMLAWAGTIRQRKPDLVLIAIPGTANALTEEHFIRSYSGICGSATSYVTREWDLVGILPSVLTPRLNRGERGREELAREIIRGYDTGMIEREPGDESSVEEIVTRWFKRQAGTGDGA